VPERELADLVDGTEVVDVRLQRFEGEMFRTPPDGISVSLDWVEPRYSLEDGAILALYENVIRYTGADPEDETKTAPVATVTVRHIVELSLDEGDVPSADAVSQLLRGTVLFLVYPYVRAALHRLPAEFGLPGFLLPYLRRNVSAPGD